MRDDAATLLRRDASIPAISVAGAFVSRFFVLFAGRPDFVGWFNHSPYFWVQSRSLIEGNGLAYGDMPLVFALYAGLAKGISLAGVPQEPAIIMASRLVMTVAPALIPIFVYVLARGATGGRRLNWPTRCLVLASGFLPLTFAHMPEHLQKNMMGMLLLACLLTGLFRWLRSGRSGQLFALLLLLVAICLAHLGSALAALLLVVAMTIDFLLRRASPTQLVRVVLLSTAVVIALGLGIREFDPAATERVAALVAGLKPEDSRETLIFLLVVIVWLGLLVMLWRWFALRTSEKNPANSALGGTVILWMGLLAMPLWPGETGLRLMLFMPLGFVILQILALSVFRGARIFRYVAVTTTVAFGLMSAGEAVSLHMIYPDKERTSRQLAAVADKYRLSRDDLVITPYGVNPIASWFLGTKGSLLTAVRQDVAERHDRVFVLNTLERRAPELETSECRLFESEDDRYWATRHDIPLDDGSMPDADFDTFAFYRLEKLPENWVFDDAGLWAGWGDCP